MQITRQILLVGVVLVQFGCASMEPYEGDDYYYEDTQEYYDEAPIYYDRAYGDYYFDSSFGIHVLLGVPSTYWYDGLFYTRLRNGWYSSYSPYGPWVTRPPAFYISTLDRVHRHWDHSYRRHTAPDGRYHGRQFRRPDRGYYKEHGPDQRRGDGKRHRDGVHHGQGPKDRGRGKHDRHQDDHIEYQEDLAKPPGDESHRGIPPAPRSPRGAAPIIRDSESLGAKQDRPSRRPASDRPSVRGAAPISPVPRSPDRVQIDRDGSAESGSPRRPDRVNDSRLPRSEVSMPAPRAVAPVRVPSTVLPSVQPDRSRVDRRAPARPMIGARDDRSTSSSGSRIPARDVSTPRTPMLAPSPSGAAPISRPVPSTRTSEPVRPSSSNVRGSSKKDGAGGRRFGRDEGPRSQRD